MANQVPTWFVTKFTTEVEYKVQQMPARFWEASEIRSESGSGAVAVEQIGATNASVVTGRLQPIVFTDTPQDRRWVYPQKLWWADAVDTYEKLEVSIDPQGFFAKNATYALNRQKDDIWISSFFGTAQTSNASTTGNAPATAVPFPAGQVVSVNTGSSGGATPVGMNVPKLRAARLLMLSAEVDFDNETPYAGMSAQQMDNMLNQAQAISLDFNDKPVLVEGKITSFMGFQFLHSERMPLNASAQRQCPVWVKSGMRGAVWQDVSTDIRQREDLIGLPYQVSAQMMVGATRLQEPKCVSIPCTEP